MNQPRADHTFAGSIPQLYEQYLVPLLFEPYAADLCPRVALRRPTKLLEIAAGTGVVTRHLARTLSPATSIVATDLNQAMLDVAAATRTARPVTWQQADAHQLPFADDAFDVVVCQFGAMFFTDKARAFAEVRRVLRPGGTFVFNVWDRIENNEFAATVAQSMLSHFRDEPPRFLQRVPYAWHDTNAIAQELARGHFTKRPTFVTVPLRARAESPRVPAVAFCQGTPLRGEIEAKGPTSLVEATDAATAAIERRHGSRTVEGRMQAHVVLVEK